MALTLVTGPTSEPLTVAEVRLHLKLNEGAEDSEIDRWIPAARGQIELLTDRKCYEQTWRLKLDRFPCGPIWLPFPPVSSVTSVTYIDQDGVTQTWSAALYTADLPAGPKAAPARIVPAYQQAYPQTRDVINAVTVEFVCGYVIDDVGPVPGELVQAMLLLMGHWDQHRSGVISGTIAQQLPLSVESLCWPFKAFVPEMRWW